MIDRHSKTRERERVYKTGGIMGVPIEEITAALVEVGREARRRHKALGHPIIVWRDGKVIELPPAEIEV